MAPELAPMGRQEVAEFSLKRIDTLTLPWGGRGEGPRVRSWFRKAKKAINDRWVVICPFCHGVHKHGAPKDWRVPDCPAPLKNVVGRGYEYYLEDAGIWLASLNDRLEANTDEADSLLLHILDERSRPALDKIGEILEADPDTGHDIAQLIAQGSSIREARIIAAQDLLAKGPIEAIRAVQRARFKIGSVA